LVGREEEMGRRDVMGRALVRVVMDTCPQGFPRTTALASPILFNPKKIAHSPCDEGEGAAEVQDQRNGGRKYRQVRTDTIHVGYIHTYAIYHNIMYARAERRIKGSIDAGFVLRDDCAASKQTDTDLE
jgi:hypothetical protein